MTDSPSQKRTRLSLADFAVAGVLALVGLILLCFAGLHWQKARDKTITRVDVSAFENSTPPQQRWASVTGQAHADQVVSFGERHFIPVTSPQAIAYPVVALFIEARTDDLEEIHHASRFHAFEGMLSREGLPGDARNQFAAAGRVAANGYYVLELNKTPADERRAARDFAIFGGGLMLAAIVLLVVQSLRNRTATTAIKPLDPRFEIKQIKL